MGYKVKEVFNFLRSFLWIAASRSEPSAEEVQKLVAPLVNLLMEINSFKDSKRNSPLFNHLCAVSEGVPAVGWVLVKKTPASYVKEMLDSSTFYINRIFKEFKDGDQTHVEWARVWKELLEAMQTFVRQTHTTGLAWNSAPGWLLPSSAEHDTNVGFSATVGLLPPPPPPPRSLFTKTTPNNPLPADGKASRDALFAEINKGEAITASLKKVTADMQTHKNPSLREKVPSPQRGGSHVKKVVSCEPARNPPVVELKDGKQWNVLASFAFKFVTVSPAMVMSQRRFFVLGDLMDRVHSEPPIFRAFAFREYIVDNPNLVVTATDKKQTVYVYKCQDSVIIVKGKVNSIILDSCRKTSIVFDALLAQCETINCQSVHIQALGEMPTLSIQKTDGCQVYLSEVSKNAEIITSKSTEMNLLIPMADGDFVSRSSFLKNLTRISIFASS
ncbi:DE Adenylate cyclase associated [Necator americanus]|uniref:DE Adenylate cyclase associated n=1 Tax=Necator americanus TaxID=51031 RepID=W2TSB8_NECAM|nr:DE Adenylate cyclase associated [Necator americanus]ETN84011.1 DE Adenylate cyclase associated [Necator americanus]